MTKNTNEMNGINYFWSFWQMTSVILLLFMIKLTKSVTDIYNISDIYNITKYKKYNITKNEDYELEYVPYDKRPETYFTPLIFFLIMFIGLIGNSLLALIIIRNLNLRNVSNMYLLSLAIGDILVLITCVPFTTIVYVLDSWPFGLSACKLGECAKDIFVAVNIFSLTVLSADRFYALVNPKKLVSVNGNSRKFAASIILTIWILGIALAIPSFTFSSVKCFKDFNGNISFCVCYPFPEELGPNYPKFIVTCRFIIYYVIPLSIVSIYYVLMARHLLHSTKIIIQIHGEKNLAHDRRKVAIMVITLVVMFAICFLPQHIFMLWFYFNPSSEADYNAFWHYFRILGFCLSFANSCVNPIALYCTSNKYKKRFNKYFRYLCCIKWRQQSDRRGRYSFLSSRKLGVSHQESDVELSFMKGNVRRRIPTEQEAIL